MIAIPYDCPRDRDDCRALSNIVADDGRSFFCCGENNGESRTVLQDKYTVCFRGEYRDAIDHYDKRDLIHHASVMVQSLAVIEKCHDPDLNQEQDWSPWAEQQDGRG